MDPGSIAAIASSYKKLTYPLKVFSTIPPYTTNEKKWIDDMVKTFNLDHQYLQINLNKMDETINDILSFHDEPFLSSNCIYQFLLRKKIKESDVKVLLVGEGGDEVLSGYRRFIYPYLYDIRSKLNKIDFEKVLKKAENFLEIKKELIIENFEKFQKEYFSSNSQQENQSAYPILSKSFNEEYLSLKKKPTYLKTSKNNETILSLFLYNHIFIRDLPNILKMEDSNSMANSIESRVPFLDHKFVEYCVSHNTEEFMKNGENKAMLRQAMGKILPKVFYLENQNLDVQGMIIF